MAQSEDPAQGDTTAGREGPLRAQLAIEPHPESHCAVVNAGIDAEEVTHHLKVDSSTETGEEHCGECHTELAFGNDDEHQYLKSAVETKCICPIFQNHDCIPRIQGVESGSIVVVLTVPTRESLRAIISDLREVGASVSLDWIVDGSEGSQTAEIDVSAITDKQREALELAREEGYYETPRQTDLGEIASKLGISESAASQRLNAAETKLVTSYLGE